MARQKDSPRHRMERAIAAGYYQPPMRFVSNRVTHLVMKMKKERQAAMKASRSMAVAKASTVKKIEGSFPILALPREIRDEIYSHVISLKSEGAKSIYDNVTCQAQNHFRRERRSQRSRGQCGDEHSSSPMLFLNHQIHQEIMETIYCNSMFFVTMDLKSPIFRSQMKMRGDEEAAVPFGWDLSKIKNLAVRLDLGSQNEHLSTLKAFDFPGLKDMQKLSTLRLVVTISTIPYRVAHNPLALLLEDMVDDDGPCPETAAFRTMLRSLRNARPEPVHRLHFGLADSSYELMPRDWCILKDIVGAPKAKLTHEVPAEFLSTCYDPELRRGADGLVLSRE